MSAVFALGGGLAGILQAALLSRMARGDRSSFGPVPRLGLVFFVLLLAARAGHLASTAAGWAAGFSLCCGWTVASLRTARGARSRR